MALSHDLGSRTFSYPVLWHLLTKQSRPLCGKLRVYTYCTYHSQFLHPTDHLSEAKCHRYFFTSKAYSERTPLTSLLSYPTTISLPLCVEKRDGGLGFLIAYKYNSTLQKERKTEKLHCTNIRIYIIFKSSQISDSRNKIFTYIMQFFFLYSRIPAFTEMQCFKLKSLSFFSFLGDIHRDSTGKGRVVPETRWQQTYSDSYFWSYFSWEDPPSSMSCICL